MAQVTCEEFNRALGNIGWPKATYEFGKRYTVTRYQLNGGVAEKHQMLKRNRPDGDPIYMLPDTQGTPNA